MVVNRHGVKTVQHRLSKVSPEDVRGLPVASTPRGWTEWSRTGKASFQVQWKESLTILLKRQLDRVLTLERNLPALPLEADREVGAGLMEQFAEEVKRLGGRTREPITGTMLFLDEVNNAPPEMLKIAEQMARAGIRKSGRTR